jgi:hypothetical protein
MKILFADFKIQKYGGIVEYMSSMLKAFKELGNEVDVVQMNPSSVSQKFYDKRIKELESGDYNKRINFNSQSGGYEKDEATGYWRNNYYGFFLPPSNRIGVYEDDSLEHWRNIANKFDIILWNFMPTKNSIWTKRGIQFDFWWKFFDLPNNIKQVFIVHDAYFNVRASNISALKDKIHFLACAHLAAYHCCNEIGIPRALLLNPRYISDNARMPIRMIKNRNQDFFAAHMFKTMKHMEELIAAIPYLNKEYSIEIAGTGMEYNYMTSSSKIKKEYICNKKRDPDLPNDLDQKISLWNRAINYNMEYSGQMSGHDVREKLKNTKFAIDPSWSRHYSKYCRTHINGFIIEAMLEGAYPVLRDYRGLTPESKGNLYDPLFENIRAIIIPWDSTPRQFADKLKDAFNMSSAKFFKDTKHNFEIVRELFNAKKNALDIIKLCKLNKKDITKELEVGKDSDNVIRITKEIMEGFYKINLPINWKT